MRIAGIYMSLVAMLLFAVSSYAEIDPGTIVAAWSFNEGSGTTAGDSSGNGNDGTIVDAQWVDGRIGKALEFDGGEARVEVPALGSFDELTIAEWVYCTGKVGQWRVLINNEGWKTGDVHHQLHTNNQIEFSINGSPGGNDTFANFAFDDSQLNVWHHLATVYSSEGWIRFYVDGELDAENSWGGNPAVLDTARIGNWDGRGWQGILDEFIILSVALEESDIQSLMSGGVEVTPVEPTGKLATTWGGVRAQY